MTSGGPRPVAPFSHGVETEVFVFVPGQMPDTPQTPGVLPDGIVAQTRAVMENLKVVLAGVDLGLQHAALTRSFLTPFKEHNTPTNASYLRVFPPARPPAPPRAGVSALAYDA